MAKESTVNVEKVKHDNIYAALSAFQGENPEIKKSKHVDFTTKTGQRVDYWYAPLDEFVATIRPLLSKHGLSFTHEDAGDGKIRCVLYHETYEAEPQVTLETSDTEGTRTQTRSETRVLEKNVIRSMPITVRRAGDMKDIGGDATYARRYTLAEVTGCASDEDKDTPLEEESAKNAVKTVFISTKDKITKGDKKYIEDIMVMINKELDLIENKKAPKLGLTEDQYNELGRLAEAKLQALGIKEDIEHEEPSVTVQ